MHPSEEQPTTPWPDVSRTAGEDALRLAPGRILEHRYRIVAPIARGGMGVLYQADDLRLGQRVALKFLSPEVAHDSRVVARLVSEVRLGRQVAHPNVCRLYDLVDLEEHACIVMEYVEGEDLASLLQRVGALPSARVIAIARELAAGLAAAHDQGIIHRDLKPANVMLDSRGSVKITDFGLAASTEERQSGVIGTPGYMAPELLRGKEATPQSDLYSFGLMLYEMAAGKRALDATSFSELLQSQRAGARPAPLLTVAPDTDTRLAAIVELCLDHDPSRRPASARTIREMLPGGDALTAAIEAGETPSPDVVAAAEIAAPLARTHAVLLVVTVLAATTISAGLWSRSSKARILDRISAPDVLLLRAQTIARRWLKHEPDQMAVASFEQYDDYLSYLERTDNTASRWQPVYADPAAALRFWYRRGKALAPLAAQRVTFDDPPYDPGTIAVRVDGAGRLRTFRAPATAAQRAQSPVNWNQFFQEAQLDVREFQPAAPAGLPAVASDDVRAWTRPRDGLTVIAGSLQNVPVFFDVRAKWDVDHSDPSVTMVAALFVAVWLLMSAAAVFMARTNLNRGRGDTRSAWRLACFVFVTWALFWMLTCAMTTWQMGVAYAVFAAAETWLLYVALEPHVRRRWPRVLVGWTRLLAGRFRDSQVGRDLLIGFAAAAIIRLLLNVLTPVLQRFGVPEPRPTAILFFESASRAAGECFYDLFLAVTLALSYVFLLLLFGFAVKRLSIVVAIVSTIIILIFVPMGAGLAVVAVIVPLILLVRYGLLAAVFTLYGVFLQAEMLTFDFAKWYGHHSLVSLTIITGLSLFGFLASRPVEERRPRLSLS